MKEKIYTIPVNDAFSRTGSCPICTLTNSLNGQLIDYYLGPSLMESDVRQTTNQKGFCGRHLEALYQSKQNSLGLGLMLHTHLKKLQTDLQREWKACMAGPKGGLFPSRQKDVRERFKEAADRLGKQVDACVICDRIDQTLARYQEVIFHEYFANPLFQERFKQTDTFCLPHVAWLLEGAARQLNQKRAAELVPPLLDTQLVSLEKLTGDVGWFTEKFDYRNHDKDWKDSKDALPRSIRRLTGSTADEQDA